MTRIDEDRVVALFGKLYWWYRDNDGRLHLYRASWMDNP